MAKACRDSIIWLFVRRQHWNTMRRGLFGMIYFLPTPSLMTDGDIGRTCLSGIIVDAGIGVDRNGRWDGWFRLHSDAGEIASRLAEAAS